MRQTHPPRPYSPWFNFLTSFTRWGGEGRAPPSHLTYPPPPRTHTPHIPVIQSSIPSLYPLFPWQHVDKYSVGVGERRKKKVAADRGGRKKPKANVHTHTAGKAHMKSQHIWHCHPPNNQSSLFVVEAANMTARDMRFPLSLYPVVVNLPATYL